MNIDFLKDYRREKENKLKLVALILISILSAIILAYNCWDKIDIMNFGLVEGVFGIVGIVAIFKTILSLLNKNQLLYSIMALVLLIIYSLLRFFDLILNPPKYEARK